MKTSSNLSSSNVNIFSYNHFITIKNSLPKSWEDINTIAKAVFWKVAEAAFFYFNPNIFAISFVIGVCYPDQIEKPKENIQTVLKTRYLGYIIFGAALSLQFTLVLGSIFLGANLGLQVIKNAKLLLI